MSFNLGEMSRWCIPVTSCNVVFQTVVASLAQRKEGSRFRLSRERVGDVGAFWKLSSLLASNLSLP
jgi:hypothetical protein